MVCQLARAEDIHGIISFTRVGAPDGGVESYCTLGNGDEYGWQAKYFDSMGDSQWKQIESSFIKAITTHPRLIKYYVCIPLDRQDPRIDNQKWFMDKWNYYTGEWTKLAASQQRNVDFEYWGSSELLSRLSEEKHAGRRRFWFNHEELSEQWFTDKLGVSIDSLGNRYTPKLNFELDISKTFDGLVRDSGFKLQFDNEYSELQKKILRSINTIMEESIKPYKEQLSIMFTELQRCYSSIAFDEMNDIPLANINSICDRIGKLVNECIANYKLLKSQESNNQNSSHFHENNKYNSQIYDLRQAGYTIGLFKDFLQKPAALLANVPALMLKGVAGIGKSHLLADIALKKMKDGTPVILLLGQHFIDEQNPWTQILNNQLRVNMNEDEFLGALDAKAQSIGKRALLMIDAINEGKGRLFWPDHIKGFIRTVRKYNWVGLVLSIRSSYEDLITPIEILPNDIIIRVTHHGFTDQEYEASKLFFDNYKIKQPSIPLLHPEFQNPLFLKIFCEGLYKSGLSVIPEGFEGITQILNFYITSINKRFSEPSKFDYPSNTNLVKKAITAIIAKKLEVNSQIITFDEANRIVCNEVREYTDKWRHFLIELISEGILTQNIFYTDKKNYENGIYFAYERFEDHISTSFLLDKYIDIHDPKSSFKKGQVLYEYIKDESVCYSNKGVIEALSIQLPERIGMELFEAAPSARTYYPIIEAFITGLLWRKTDTITEKIIPYLNKIVLTRKGTFEQFWDTILQISSNPKHFFNGERIHKHLMKYSLAERDAIWTQYISDKFLEHSSIKRNIDWAWTTEDRSYISDDSIKLTAITITWFMTSPNRKLRDYATKSLVCLLQNRINVLTDVLRLFENVNDPYLYERLFAVAYGCALRTSDKASLSNLSMYVYQTIFSKRKVYPHVLLRDYARGIVEFAYHLGIQGNINISKIRPPYKSDWYKSIPSIEEIDDYKYEYDSEGFKKHYWAQNSIIRSMTTEYGRGTGGYGDFGRYVFQSAISNWEQHFDPQTLSNIATKRVFELGYDVNLHGEYDTYHVRSQDRHEHSNERIGKKYQWIAFHELLAKLADHYLMSEIDYSWNEQDDEKNKNINIEEWLRLLKNETRLPDDNRSIAEEISSKEPRKQEPKQRVRTRKYNNFPYYGPWNPFVRDIDTTVLITGLDKRSMNYYQSVYQLPESGLNKWVHDFCDIPNLDNIIFTSKNGTDFVLLSSHIKWSSLKSEKDFNDKEELFIKTTALLVPSDRVIHYSESKKVHDYSYGRHWESIYKIYSREFYWHPAYSDYRLEIAHENDRDQDLKNTTLEYLWEKGYDSSIEGSISYLMPSEYIVSQLGLAQGKEGYWYDKDNQLVCYDTALEGYNTGLLIEKTSLENILNRNNLSIIWDVYLEKIANKVLHEWRMVTALKDGNVSIVKLYDEETWPLNQ